MLPTPRSFSHIGLSVPDLDAAVQFYSGVMGFYTIMQPTEILEEDSDIGRMCTDVFGPGWARIRIAHMSTSDRVGIELFEFDGNYAPENNLDFRPMADGYFAVRKGEIYDMIINGTDRLVVRPDGSGTATDSALKFEETMTGSQVSFSRYGASYLVEFMCKDPATAAKGSCVSEEEALAEVEKLLIAGTR